MSCNPVCKDIDMPYFVTTLFTISHHNAVIGKTPLKRSPCLWDTNTKFKWKRNLLVIQDSDFNPLTKTQWIRDHKETDIVTYDIVSTTCKKNTWNDTDANSICGRHFASTAPLLTKSDSQTVRYESYTGYYFIISKVIPSVIRGSIKKFQN